MDTRNIVEEEKNYHQQATGHHDAENKQKERARDGSPPHLEAQKSILNTGLEEYTRECNFLSLSPIYDKRLVLSDGVTTIPLVRV